jgi:hypothetical protein
MRLLIDLLMTLNVPHRFFQPMGRIVRTNAYRRSFCRQ